MGALDGILVADFTRVLAGPLATQTLGDFGADVIKVESPGGDDTRRWGPPFADDGRATYELAVNRNKRSIVLDLTAEDDLELARRLCARADVVIANFKPGGMEGFGLGYDVLTLTNPQLVYCDISGFGSGAGASLPGYDPLVQAVGGLMSVTGPEGGPPTKVGVAVVDVLAGLYTAIAILGALRERDTSGVGQRIEVTLLGTVLAALANQSTGYLNGGVVPGTMGNSHPSVQPFGTYRAADGDLMLCAGNDGQFAALARALGMPELATSPRFLTNTDRVANSAELREWIERGLTPRPVADWAAELASAGVPAGPVENIEGAFDLAERLGLDAVDEYAGVRTPAFPAKLSRTPADTRLPPPGLDEHGAELREWLMDDAGG